MSGTSDYGILEGGVQPVVYVSPEQNMIYPHHVGGVVLLSTTKKFPTFLSA